MNTDNAENSVGEIAQPVKSGGGRRRGMSFLVVLTLLLSLFVVASPGTAGAANTCVGSASRSLGTAKVLYQRGCGERWNANSGNHQCSWGSNGWTCSGPRTQGQTCQGNFNSTLNSARASYAQVCGERWDANSGHHRCNWIDGRGGRWVCNGPSSR